MPEHQRWLADEVVSLDEPWYIAVDELGDELASLRVTPWPVLDERGRVRFFARERGFIMKAPKAALEDLADLYRSPSRPLRVGDVFAAEFAGTSEEDVPDLADLVSGPLLDVSAPAREVAKAQYFAAVAGTLQQTDVERLFADMISEEDDTDAGV